MSNPHQFCRDLSSSLFLVALFCLLAVFDLRSSPPNDYFANRSILIGTNITIAQSLDGATVEPGEQGPYTRSVWWTWTAPASGIVLATAMQSDFFGSRLAVYTGTVLPELRLITNASGDQMTRIPVAAGASYQFAVCDGGEGEANILLVLQLFPPPPNDNFADRARLDLGQSAFGWTVGATTEPGEQYAHLGRSIWWEWHSFANGRGAAYLTSVPSNTSLIVITPEGVVRDENGIARYEVLGGHHYIFGVFGPPEDSEFVQLDFELSAFEFLAPGSSATFYAPSPVQIELQVTEIEYPLDRIDLFANTGYIGSINQPPWNFTWSNPPRGKYDITAHLIKTGGRVVTRTQPIVVRPSNDLFQNTIPITGEDFTIEADTWLATLEAGEPHHLQCCDKSLWWSWTAPGDGALKLEAPDLQPFEEVITCYSGSSLNELSLRGGIFDPTVPLYITVQTGQTYHIATVSGYSEDRLEEVVCLGKFQPAPPNDSFANRQLLAGDAISLTATNLTASAEPGEPQHYSSIPQRTLWWSWIAPAQGVIRLSLDGTFFSAYVAAYTGSSISNLARANTSSGSTYQALQFEVQPGGVYQIAVDSSIGLDAQEAGGIIQFQLHFFARSPHDSFANRAALAGLPVTVEDNLSAATAQLGEPAHAGRPASQSLWWSWTAPKSGLVSIFGSCCFAMAVYEGATLESLIPVSVVQFSESALEFQAHAGTTYILAVDSFGVDYSGDISFTISDQANDNFANRIELSGNDLNITNQNLAATAEVEEPEHGGLPPARTLWWTWRAPYSGTARILLSGDFPAVAAVYSGSTLSELSPLTNIASSFFPVPRSFHAVSGTVYQVAIGSRMDPDFGAQAGSFRFALNLNTFHLARPSPGVVGVAPQELTFSLGPVVPEVVGQFSLVHFFYNLVAATPSALAAGSVNDPAHSLTQMFPLPGAYSFYALATNDSGVILQTEPVVVRLKPTNDNFTDRLHLAGASLMVTNLLAESTLELGEPRSPSDRGSIWMGWTAPSNGPYTFLCKQPFSVYSGDSLEMLVVVAGSGSVILEAQAGVEYQIQMVRRSSLPPPPETLAIQPLTLPSNDHFANRTQLAGTNLKFSVVTLGASREPDDPVMPGEEANVTLWWRWTPPAIGLLRVQSDERLHVFTYFNSTFNHRTELENGNTAEIPPGLEYNIMLSVPRNKTTESHFLLEFTPRPSNDRFYESMHVFGETTTLIGDTTLATREWGEPPARMFAVPIHGSIWWSWTAPRSAYVVLSVAPSDHEPFVEVFQGSNLESLTSLYAVTHYESDPRKLSFYTEFGQTYHISATGLGDIFYPSPYTGPGPVTIDLRIPPPPTNDDFANADAVTDARFSEALELLNATTQSDEPLHWRRTSGRSVWYSWKAPSAGRARLATGYYSYVEVYTGDTLQSLQPLPQASRYSAQWIQFFPLPNLTYYFAVASDTVEPESVFDFVFSPSPSNDRFADRLLLEGTNAQVSVAFAGAGPERELAAGEDADLWWTWTAPASGRATIIQTEPGFNLIFALYYGSSSSNLTLITRSANELSFNAVVGRTYQIQVIGEFLGDAAFTLGLSHLQPALRPTLHPMILHPVTYTSTGYAFTVSGTPGETFLIETSSDLINWVPLGLQSFYGTISSILDTQTNTAVRFYRARSRQ